MDLGVKLDSFDYSECSLRTNEGIDEIFDTCYQEFLSKSNKKRKKRQPTILSQKIEEETKQGKLSLKSNRRKSGSFLPLTSIDEQSPMINQIISTHHEETSQQHLKLEFEIEKLYSIINFLQKENQERKFEIEELKKIIKEKKEE